MRLVRSIAQGRGQPAPHQGQLYLLMTARISPFGGAVAPPPFPPPRWTLEMSCVVGFSFYLSRNCTPQPPRKVTEQMRISFMGMGTAYRSHNTTHMHAMQCTQHAHAQRTHTHTHTHTHTPMCPHSTYIHAAWRRSGEPLVGKNIYHLGGWSAGKHRAVVFRRT